MSKEFKSIKRGLQQAIKHAAGEGPIARTHKPKLVNSKKVKALHQDKKKQRN